MDGRTRGLNGLEKKKEKGKEMDVMELELEEDLEWFRGTIIAYLLLLIDTNIVNYTYLFEILGD